MENQIQDIIKENGLKNKLNIELNKQLEIDLENILLNNLENNKNKINQIQKIIDKNKFYLSNKYDNIIHKYLELKINCNDIFCFINDIKDINIKKQLLIIDSIIDENNLIHKNLLDKKYNENSLFHCYLEYIDCNNKFDEDDNTNKLINIIKKITPIRIKKYYSIYNDNYLFNTYQCYFKSALYFFLNNGNYINKIIKLNNNSKLINLTPSERLNKLEYNNIDSDIINTDKYIKYGGKLSDIIIKNIKDNIINNNIYNNIISDVRDYLNDKYNNKYLLCIPGIKVYPSIVINDILKLENNYFSEKCFFKLDNKVNNLCGYIYDLTNNLSYLSINSIIIKFLTNNIDWHSIEHIKNDINYFENELIKSLQQIKNNQQLLFTDFIVDKFINLPDNLLIHCPLYDSHELLMSNNIFNIMKKSKINITYKTIKKIFNIINNYYNINIIYPYYIKIQDINYYLHSFIICNSNEKFDSHFVYYKIDYNKNNIIRIDGDKKRIIYFTEKNKYYEEYKILDIKNNRIIDNMKTKVVFVCYRKIY